MNRTTDFSSLDLSHLVETVRNHTGTKGKGAISRASRFIRPNDPIHGPGDDGAIVEMAGQKVVACGEAISPPFVEGDPYGAGIAAILANVNDVAAMGGLPTGIVNTVVGPPAVVTQVLLGLEDAAAMYDVPIIGGHLTDSTGPCALSAFALGHAEQVLSMAHVRPGQALLLACCLEGEMRKDFPFFTSIERQKHRLASDVRLLARAASLGLAVAAKDVSMAGSLGSLAMLLEYSRCGAELQMDRHPVPADTDPMKWGISFPTYAFWLAAEPETVADCIALFEDRDLTCAQVGWVRSGGKITLSRAGESQVLFDLATESITGLWA